MRIKDANLLHICQVEDLTHSGFDPPWPMTPEIQQDSFFIITVLTQEVKMSKTEDNDSMDS